MQLIQTICEGHPGNAGNEGGTPKVSGEIESKSSSFGSQTETRGLKRRSLSGEKDDENSDGDSSDDSLFIPIIVKRKKAKKVDGESEVGKPADAEWSALKLLRLIDQFKLLFTIMTSIFILC